jgi:hypothetical protein
MGYGEGIKAEEGSRVRKEYNLLNKKIVSILS